MNPHHGDVSTPLDIYRKKDGDSMVGPLLEARKKVFILSDGGHDYSDAERFGELIFLNVPAESKWDISYIYDFLREKLTDASPDDCLIVSSLTSICCVATAIMVEWFGRVNFLIFRFDRYEEKKLVLNRVIE
jgi:hypothetical protein